MEMVNVMKVNVGVSNHHVHLTKETWVSLFGDKPMIKRNDLSQKGEFATIETVTLENNNKILEHVRIMIKLKYLSLMLII